MSKMRLNLVIFILGALVALLAALGQSVPGYMDAEYYYSTGIRLASGHGFTEPFLWNYLDNPIGIPHPSHLYWMPLASMLAAAGMKLLASTSFWAARLPFILMAGILPVLSASLVRRMSQSPHHAWLAGLLAIFPGIYLVYYSLTETFILYILLGGLIWWLVFRDDWETISTRKLLGRAGLLGLLAGAMHLSRADGIVWLAGVILWAIFSVLRSNRPQKLRIASISTITIFFVYMLVMGAWYTRNIQLFGTLFAAGNNRGLWITNYNQTFSFPADQITFAGWWGAGLGVHAGAWWNALVMNLKTLVTVQGMVIFLPLAIAGLWPLRKKPGLQFFGLMWLATLGLMTIVFPYAGARGGFLHSASAFQTVIWAAVPAGLERFVEWGRNKRNWQPGKAFPVFGSLIVAICMILTGWFYAQKVYGLGIQGSQWGASSQTYQSMQGELERLTDKSDVLYLVNDPPGFWLATGKSSIVIPGGDISQTLAAGKQYNATILILESGQENLAELYAKPTDFPGLNYLGDIGNARIFCVNCQDR